MTSWQMTRMAGPTTPATVKIVSTDNQPPPVQMMEVIDTNQEECLILRLVPDVLLHIFSFLKVAERQKVAQVCTDWLSIAYHPSLWRRVEPRVKKLVQPSLWFKLPSKEGEPAVKKRKHPMLASLLRRGIKRVKVEDDETLIHVTHNMAGLKSLTLADLRWSEPISQVLRQAFNTKLDALSELSLARCYKLKSKNVKLIVQNAVNITHLDLCNTYRLDNKALRYVSELSRLNILILSSCPWLSHKGIGHLARANLSLKWLDVHNCYGLSNEALRLICVGLTGLEHLDLARCYNVTDAGLKHLGEVANSRLTWLNISYCTLSSQGLQHLTTLNRLKELRVLDCRHMGNKCMRHVAQISSLRLLDLGEMPITESGLSLLASAGLKITYLSVNLVDRVTDDCCISLSKLNQLQTLTLKMHIGMSDISDKGVSLFMRPDSNLVTLILLNADWLRNSTFVLLARMKRLRRLHVNCRNFDCASAILNLVDGGSQLEHLGLFMTYEKKQRPLNEIGLLQVTRLARLKTFDMNFSFFTENVITGLKKSGLQIKMPFFSKRQNIPF